VFSMSVTEIKVFWMVTLYSIMVGAHDGAVG
jgi:hypothetical protein